MRVYDADKVDKVLKRLEVCFPQEINTTLHIYEEPTRKFSLESFRYFCRSLKKYSIELELVDDSSGDKTLYAMDK